METWSFRTLVFVFPHPSSARSCHELADSGINTGTHPNRSHRHSSDFDVHRHLTATLRSCWVHCHAAIVVLTASVARHHRLLTLHFHWHVNNLVARTGPVEALARSDFGHVHVLATESYGVKLAHCASTTHLLYSSRVKAGLDRVSLISSTPSSFNSLIAS